MRAARHQLRAAVPAALVEHDALTLDPSHERAPRPALAAPAMAGAAL
ncbi:hypothetical protein [Actinospica sp.]|nr:hypothetical protein [Actinospica sp.]HWG26174.1 hypothetical protein [Actinospica sp.]